MKNPANYLAGFFYTHKSNVYFIIFDHEVYSNN